MNSYFINGAGKFLKCPQEHVIVDRYTCDKCDKMIDITTDWEGDVGDKRLQTRIDCLSGSTRFSLVAIPAEDEERLSEL